MAGSNRLRRAVGVILSVSYGIGSIASGFLEYRDHLFSERFDLPSELLYLAFVIQAVSAIGVLLPRFARPAALCLTATSIGAIFAHFRIGSPETSIVAFFFSILQLWYWYLTGRTARKEKQGA